MSNLFTALIVGLVAGICEWDIYGWGHIQTCRPVVCGPLMGLVLGDLQTGLYIGASLEFLYLGVVSVGAAIPPDSTSATCIATALAIISGLDKEIAVSLAVPVAAFAQMLQMLIWTINVTWMHRADKSAAVGDIDGACRWHYVGCFLFFLQGFVPAFIAIAFGAELVKNLVLPAWLSGWLMLAGNMLASVGFAMLFVLMNKPKITPFFIIGFVLAAAFKANLISTALLGAAFALLYVNTMGDGEKKRRVRGE